MACARRAHGERHATNWNANRRHSHLATAGQPDHFTVTPELPVCTMCFLFNHSSASSSPTLPETQREKVENKQTADDYSLELKIGAWISLELPSSTTASCFSHVCASATPDWCIASSTASHIITYSQTVHVTSLKLQGQTMRTHLLPERCQQPDHQTCGVPDLLDLNKDLNFI